MEVVVNAKYGVVLKGNSTVYYVPTKTPPWQTRAPAESERIPALRRTKIATITETEGEYVSLSPGRLIYTDGVVTFDEKSKRAVSRAEDWAQIEELVGPLQYRYDVEAAAMYLSKGTCRPRIPLRVARHGPGAIAIYLYAHDHGPMMVKKALGLTYHELTEYIYTDVVSETPSFQWDNEWFE